MIGLPFPGFRQGSRSIRLSRRASRITLTHFAISLRTEARESPRSADHRLIAGPVELSSPRLQRIKV
jgi:hypothetical protein